MSKNVKWYLKDTNRQVCLGDEVTFKQSINFSRYPNTTFETTTTHPLDEEDIKALIEAELIYEKEEKPVEEYTSYLKWLADAEGLKYTDVLSSFSVTLQVNPSAALSILLKAISRKMNKLVNVTPRKVWLIDITTKKSFMMDVDNANRLKNVAWFFNKEDAEYALKVCGPVIKHCEE